MVNTRKSTGISLLEALLFLVIAGLVLMVTFRYFTQSNERQRINNAHDQIAGIIAAAHSFLNDNAGDLSDITIPVLAARGYVNQAAMEKSPWGGENSVEGSSDGENGSQLAITIAPVPLGSCEQLLNSVLNSIQDTEADEATCEEGGTSTDFIVYYYF
jgi:type II secretory pathway pseudopilin PulG